MVDEILAREVFLCHRSIPIVLISEVAVKIDFRRHDCLAGQVDAGGAGRKRNLPASADLLELRVLDKEC